MIRFQIAERPGADLHRTLIAAMRSGELRTFEAQRRGRRVVHRNPAIPGWMSWSRVDGLITAEIRSPRHPGAEWHFFSAFMGRLADRYADSIESLNVQFPAAVPDPRARPARAAGRAPAARRPSKGRRATATRHTTRARRATEARRARAARAARRATPRRRPVRRK